MRFYQATHSFYCGVDLHARTMHVCVVDADGQDIFGHTPLDVAGGRGKTSGGNGAPVLGETRIEYLSQSHRWSRGIRPPE